MQEEEVLKENDKVAKRGILGFLIGLAVIIPGISGSTLAIMFKLYDKLLYAIANIFKKFKYCFLFLLPIVIGAVVGVLVGLVTVQKLLEIIPFAIVLLFAGLMLGALPSLYDEIDDKRITKSRVGLFISGLLIPILISVASIISKNNGFGVSLNVDFLTVCVCVILGFVVALTQFVPGCSATATLMAVGFYMPLLDTMHLSYWKDNLSIFVLYGALAVGFLAGCLIISKAMNKLLAKHKNSMYFMFIGLSFGSIIAMISNCDMMDIYSLWLNGGTFALNPIFEIIFGVVLFIAGVIIAFSLVLYNRKKNKSLEK